MNQTLNQPAAKAAQADKAASIHRRAVGREWRVAVIASAWHRDIVASATEAIQAEFDRSRIPKGCLQLFEVPGAFEIPLLAQRLARGGRGGGGGGGFDAIIACGLVVNGGIYRHEFVAAAVIDGLMRVQLDTDVPIFSCVLTPREFHEHDAHRQFFLEHLRTKGTEVARCCLDTLARHGEVATSAMPH